MEPGTPLRPVALTKAAAPVLVLTATTAMAMTAPTTRAARLSATTPTTSGRGSLLTCGDVERNPGPRQVVLTAAATRPRRNVPPPVAEDAHSEETTADETDDAREAQAEQPELNRDMPSDDDARGGNAADDDGDEDGRRGRRAVRGRNKLPCPGCRAEIANGVHWRDHVRACHHQRPEAFTDFFARTGFFQCADCGVVQWSSTDRRLCLHCAGIRGRARDARAAADDVRVDHGAPDQAERRFPLSWDEISAEIPGWRAHRYVHHKRRDAIAGHLHLALQVDTAEALKRWVTFPSLVLYGQSEDVVRRARQFSAGAFDLLLEERREQPRRPHNDAVPAGYDVDDELARLPLSTDAAALPTAVAERVVALARSGALSRANAALSQARIATGPD
eukprot:PhM_4_TR13986/c1_g1_i1/m.81722